MSTVGSLQVGSVPVGPFRAEADDVSAVLHAETVALAKRLHRVLVERAVRSDDGDATGGRAYWFSQAEAIIDAAAGVGPTDRHQILDLAAAIRLRLDTFVLESPGETVHDARLARSGNRPVRP